MSPPLKIYFSGTYLVGVRILNQILPFSFFSFPFSFIGSTLVVALLSVVSLRVVASSAETPAIIINSGSTNTCPYTISVQPNGQVSYIVCNNIGRHPIIPNPVVEQYPIGIIVSEPTIVSDPVVGYIPISLATKFFNDISEAEPLSKLPTIACAKSASFGTTTKVEYNKETSPDLSCSNDSRAINLLKDTAAIREALDFNIIRNPL